MSFPEVETLLFDWPAVLRMSGIGDVIDGDRQGLGKTGYGDMLRLAISGE